VLQRIRVKADSRVVTGEHGVVVPKAPGVGVLDFGHTVRLPAPPSAAAHVPGAAQLSDAALALAASTRDPAGTLAALLAAWRGTSVSALVRQDFHTPLLPCGFLLKLVIWSSWGDPHYVGLAGLEVWDAGSGRVELGPEHVVAAPTSSVADLPQMARDARTPAKLVRWVRGVREAASQLANSPRTRSGGRREQRRSGPQLAGATAAACERDADRTQRGADAPAARSGAL